MEFEDALALFVLGSLLYITVTTQQMPAPRKDKIASEVDMTRYRHNGIQPLVWDRGNGAPAPDWTIPLILQEIS